MSRMRARRLGTWLAILAITLQAAWPLLANARLRGVTLVPLCTVDGVTHYLEVPTGTAPLDHSASAHHQHCSFCSLGASALLHSEPLPQPVQPIAERASAPVPTPRAREALLISGARAPPLFPVVTFISDNLGERDEQASGSGRADVRAAHGSRLVRLGLLHHQHELGRARRLA
jgi:hypothetical protein